MRPVAGRVLWAARGEDERGAVRLRASATPAGLAVMRNNLDGTWTGLTLTREQVQQLRHVLTLWLVDAAPDPRS